MRFFPLLCRLAVPACLAVMPPAPPAAADDGAAPVLFLNPAKRDAGAVDSAPTSLRFLTVDGFSPFSAFDAAGQVRGVHVDLARALCLELGAGQSCTLQVVAFKDVPGILTSGQADAALAGLVPDAANRETLAFSEPYARLPARFAVNATSKSTEQGVVAGSVHAAMAAALFPDVAFKTYPDQTAMLADLKSGVVASAFGEGTALGLWAASPLSAGCCALRPGAYFLPALRPDALRIAFSATRPELKQAFDRALRDIQTSGRLGDMMLRHLPFDLAR